MKVLFNSVRLVDVDPHGAGLVIVGEREQLAFEGDSAECARFLECVPVGASVTVRHAGGIRSCMNKPALWADVANYV